MARRSVSEANSEATRRALPARSSRGTRIRKLVGEEAEADESFWNQNAWNEDEEDEDYSTEEEEEDVVDEDFDEEEAPDDEVHDEQDDEPKRKRRAPLQSGSYKEPTIRAPKKPRVALPGLLPSHSNNSSLPTTPSAVFQYEGPTVRTSTARKSSVSSELRKKVTQEAALKKPVTPAGKPGNRLTQAELLAEAVRTEVENVQSLSRLEQLEEEKKAESMAPKAPLTVQMVRYHSRVGMPTTITFLNTSAYPSIFNQVKPKRPQVIQRTRRFSRDESDELKREETKNDPIVQQPCEEEFPATSSCPQPTKQQDEESDVKIGAGGRLKVFI